MSDERRYECCACRQRFMHDQVVLLGGKYYCGPCARGRGYTVADAVFDRARGDIA
jgi:hypothetical protein